MTSLVSLQSIRMYHDNYLALLTCNPIVSSGLCNQAVNNECCPGTPFSPKY